MKEEMTNRFLMFAAKVIELGKKLNKTYEGRHIYGQLFRAASSSGANYEESHSAESTRDFIHKRQIVLKELRESFFWLRLINFSKLISPEDEVLVFLLKENEELIKIIAKSTNTVKQKN
ncbi:MAG: four helix bundle protein [Bacteroidota bacterium]